ncbi:hypothetical protein B5807_10004 [Epicoccum nigrum]|uniref:Uncharacterized protein n=1 Tax=Epicoccum nigrum TaxID=105696 RepID=A0A1Y2LUK9_EPING|nr:hypothetical protein B5807_10004 [Epicoccum nigrum]
MHLPLFPLLALLPLASSLALPQALLPTGQTVVQDIINIHEAVLELDDTVQAYNGSPFPTSLVDGTPVLLGVAKIHEVNRAGFRHALAALPFTISDSEDVIDTVTNTEHPGGDAAPEGEAVGVQEGSVDPRCDCEFNAVAERS